MKRVRLFGLAMMPLGAMLCSTGCTAQLKERVDLLTRDNQQLMDEVMAARDARDLESRAREMCEQDLIAARRETDGLRTQLANVPEPQVIERVVDGGGGWQNIPGGSMIAVEGDVLFQSGKVTLRSGAKKELAAIARDVMGRFSDREILVYGHTDNQPIKKSGWKDNYELSAQRALAVVRYLQEEGVKPARLVACGCGEHRPRSPNDSKDGRQRNRRVELFALTAGVDVAAR